MISKLILTACAFLVLGFAAEQITREPQRSSNNASSVVLVNYNFQGTCGHNLDDIKSALHQLASGEFSQVEHGKGRLLDYARESAACRGTVVKSLMESMDKPNLKLEGEAKNYFIWREGSLLLGELKATEALDLLISHLDLTTGFHSNSKIFQPAIVGVTQLGQAAVPKLTVALLHVQKPRIRMAAAYCLTEIGGRPAMDALRQALKNETDRCVARFIDLSLSTFTYKSRGRVMFDNKAPQGNAEVRRNWQTAFECVDAESTHLQ